MPYIKYKVFGSIPIPEGVIDIDTQKIIDDADRAISKLRSRFTKINDGLPNEEVPSASKHICNHDIGLPCEDEIEL